MASTVAESVPDSATHGSVARVEHYQGTGRDRARPDNCKEDTCLEQLLWHAAGLTALEMRVWYLVDQGIQNIGLMAKLLGVHRVAVSRALSALREHGLVRRSPQQNRHKGKYERLAYEAAGTRGNLRTG